MNRSRRRRTRVDEHDHEEVENHNVVVDEENRRIFLFGPLTDEKAANFLMVFQNLDAKDGPINVALTSPGGSTHAGYVIYDAITLSRNPVIVEGYGKVFSMAVLVLQAGDVRLLSPQCEVMVHDIYVEAQGEITVKDAGKLAIDLVDDNKRYQRLVAKRIKMPLGKFGKMCAAETFLSAPEAIKFGFADKLLPIKKKRS